MTIAAPDSWVGSIELPLHWQGAPEQKRALENLLNARLPFAVDVNYQTLRLPFEAILTPSPTFPTIVHWESLKEEMEACKPGEIVIGLTARRNVFKGSFLTDDPHWGFSVGSRRGKSTFLCWTCAQILHQDPKATATGIDVKRESFTPLLGVPGFTLSNDPKNIPHMWETIKAFREEMDRRCDARAEDPTLEFPFSLLCIDEVNQFSAQSAHLWRRIKEKSDPAYPPVWDDIAAVFWQGAAFRCHVIVCGQRLDDRTTGGIGLNTSLGLRGLAGFRPRDWDRLVGTYPVPRSRKERGRWIYSDGDDETWVQNMWGSVPDIRDWALLGRRPAPQEGSGSGIAWVVGLDAAAAHLDISKAAFIKRRQKRGVPGEQKQGNQPAWRASDLNSWAAAGELVTTGASDD